MSFTESVVYITGTAYSSRARGFTHSFKWDSVANLFSFLYYVLFLLYLSLFYDLCPMLSLSLTCPLAISCLFIYLYHFVFWVQRSDNLQVRNTPKIRTVLKWFLNLLLPTQPSDDTPFGGMLPYTGELGHLYILRGTSECPWACFQHINISFFVYLHL